MTIPELLSLNDDELKVRFYRDVLGWSVESRHFGDVDWFVLLNGSGEKEDNYVSEAGAWRALPPVSPEVWLAEMDKLTASALDKREFRFDVLSDWTTIYEVSAFTNEEDSFVAHVEGKSSEALKRAVMIASIFTHQRKEDDQL